MTLKPLAPIVGLILVLALGGANSAGAQKPLQVTLGQNLTFGNLLPGRVTTVLRTDAVKAGRLDISGGKNKSIRLSFVLPASMVGPGGATVPLTFGAGSAGYSQSLGAGTQTGFDPGTPFNTTLSNNVPDGLGYVFLGATATTGPTQVAGNYTATVTLTVVYFP